LAGAQVSHPKIDNRVKKFLILHLIFQDKKLEKMVDLGNELGIREHPDQLPSLSVKQHIAKAPDRVGLTLSAELVKKIEDGSTEVSNFV
jgi:hypothetical protein